MGRDATRVLAGALAAGAFLLCADAGAQGFAALVSPPRFELAAKPGEKLRQVMEITNASAQGAKYRLRTADWSLDAAGSVKFDEPLAAGSCRPWVAIESRQVSVAPGGKYRYRFEIAVPEDAKPGECRFAIMVEGDEQSVQTPGGPSFPISGRLGVIVYVTIGDAHPELEVVGARVESVNNEPTPVISVKNNGTAHGRLTGFLSGTDASGRKLDFTPSTLPILVGESRTLPLVVYGDKDEAVKIAYPITIRGKLEWSGKSAPFEQTFSR
ncbi:MAG TPA: hypothetical protein VH301_13595 [Usitatibacter sp.]|jgi:hypothetical protein|nr:hypothetical protein [Usitatibacter sp.]